jgi:hypothetical protein
MLVPMGTPPIRRSAPDGVKVDPLVLEAVGDVDQLLLDWSLSLSPRERLRACYKATVALARFRHDAPSSD